MGYNNNFKIKINDGFCEWEYTLPTDGKLSIQNIADMIFYYYDQPRPTGKLIKPNK